ncbi:helix-turn-helix transcriptional regulator [Desulfogranum mediterraneum]|uniref:helix-turn-helix transcriptional regulator n=1 Tax=Desulfogranum mediterraneum TaxID=160661 RepID=UPI0004014C8A|nr:helix-turn-helix transcriptional regulator [Desulfogranum mediterraneum]
MSSQQSSGNRELDSLLGGLRTGDNVVWHDEVGSLALDFFFNFLQASFAEKAHVVYVSFDRSPKNLLTTLGSLADNPLLTILDCFTHGKGGGSELFLKFYEQARDPEHARIIPVKKPEQAESLADTLGTVYSMCGGTVNYLFESLTGMQDLWGGEEQVLRFYTRTCPRLYELNTIAYWVLEHNAHSRRLRSGISQIAQVVLELSVKRGHTFLTITKAEGREPQGLNTAHAYWLDQGQAVFGNQSRQFGGKRDLGGRIKTQRLRRGLAQTALAKQVGVTPSTISQVESGQIYPSIPALLKIAELLGVEMATLFATDRDLDERILFPPDATREVNFPGMGSSEITIREYLPWSGEAGFQAFMVEFAPGGALKSHFLRHKGDEFGFLLNGKLALEVNGLEKEVAAGTLINLSEHMATGWKNPSTANVQLLWIIVNG